MITVYFRDSANAIHVKEVSAASPEFPSNGIWIDMHAPNAEEIALVEKSLRVEIPSKHEVWMNHVLNRLYVEDNIAYMTAALITKSDSPYPGTSAVTFILTTEYLLTVHDIAPTSFRNFAQRLQRPSRQFQTSAHLLEGLLEEIITRVAFNSELVVEGLDKLSHDIFGAVNNEAKASSQLMKQVLAQLGRSADLNSKINESLHSINRMLVFFKQVVPSSTKNIDSNIDTLLTDTHVLTTQTSFLADKVTFQLDATLGMINVEQNQIIKIFSVVAVFFMPPTLVSSLYGMNFKHMPELDWLMGYPMAIVMMILCAVVPYLYFRKRGWL